MYSNLKHASRGQEYRISYEYVSSTGDGDTRGRLFNNRPDLFFSILPLQRGTNKYWEYSGSRIWIHKIRIKFNVSTGYHQSDDWDWPVNVRFILFFDKFNCAPLAANMIWSDDGPWSYPGQPWYTWQWDAPYYVWDPEATGDKGNKIQILLGNLNIGAHPVIYNPSIDVADINTDILDRLHIIDDQKHTLQYDSKIWCFEKEYTFQNPVPVDIDNNYTPQSDYQIQGCNIPVFGIAYDPTAKYGDMPFGFSSQVFFTND